MKKIILIILFVALSNPAQAAGFKTEKDCRSFADGLMDQFLNARFQEGFNSVKKYWPIPETDIDGLVKQIQQQWPLVTQRYGKPFAKEFVGEKRIGKSFLRYYYLHKFENHAIYWQIDFYNPSSEWEINMINFFNNVDALYK